MCRHTKPHTRAYRSFRTRFLASVTLALTVIVLAILSTSATGCVKRNPNLTPAQNINFTTHQAIAAVSVANKSMASALISLHAQGRIGKDETSKLLYWNKEVAQTIINAHEILKQGDTSEKIRAAKRIFLAIAAPNPDIEKLLNDPTTDQGVIALVGIVSSVKMWITTIAASELQTPGPAATPPPPPIAPPPATTPTAATSATEAGKGSK